MSQSQVLQIREILRELGLFELWFTSSLVARRFTVERPARNQVVGYGIDTMLNVTCTQSNRGRFEARIEVVFEDTQSQERFVIVRPVLVTIGNVEEHRALQPTTPYVAPRVPRQQRQVTEVEEGVVSRSPKKTRAAADNSPPIVRPHLSRRLSHGSHVSHSTISQKIFLLSSADGNQTLSWKPAGSSCRRIWHPKHMRECLGCCSGARNSRFRTYT